MKNRLLYPSGSSAKLSSSETTMARWVTSCFGSLGPWPLPPAMLPLEPGVLEHVADAPSIEDDAVLSISPLELPASWELVDLMVAFLPMHFEATLSKLVNLP